MGTRLGIELLIATLFIWVHFSAAKSRWQGISEIPFMITEASLILALILTIISGNPKRIEWFLSVILLASMTVACVFIVASDIREERKRKKFRKELYEETNTSLPVGFKIPSKP